MKFHCEIKKHIHTQEYLCTNGLGGFFSSTVNTGNTRRYHGLLCTSLNPPTDRFMMVSHMIESVEIKNKHIAISREAYLGAEKITGPDALKHFESFPFPFWKYENHLFSLEKKCSMTPGENTTNLIYKNTGKTPLVLNLKPLVSARNYHSLRHSHDDFEVINEMKKLTVKNGISPIYFHHSKGEWEDLRHWYHNCFYQEEKNRGFDFSEENFCPAQINILLKPGEEFTLQVSLENKPKSAPKVFESIEKKYQHIHQSEPLNWKADALWAAKQCLVQRKSTSSRTILAGYPWFADWGRDTLISLRVLHKFLDKKDTQSIIQSFLDYEKNGLIPNRFPDNPKDKVEYNTADSSLWVFVILWEIFDIKKDKKFIKKIIPTLTKIIESHLQGTDFGIKMHGKTGFLHAGKSPWQLTWMDAKIGEKTVTPREGFPVEINCLWYNALRIFDKISPKHRTVTRTIKHFEDNFQNYFWDEKNEGLCDFLDTNFQPNSQIRPNQIYALSLPFDCLDLEKQEAVLFLITNKLYTPFGLRTLDIKDREFQPKYEGSPWDRDHAYHQGTVWPFLLTEYWKSYEKIYGLESLRELLQKDLEPLIHHFYHDGCVGGISEVFDGLDPKEGKGCVQQAWSLAALIWAGGKV